jgi:hypothetical protein
MRTALAIGHVTLTVIGALTVTALGALLAWAAWQHRHKHDAKAAWERAAARKFGEG